mmetsp:Transcript_49617/g.111562  ORF Transcript_49617/g.111562 Transcript_49617/m.111562 type:complete len:228 (+) Transcript_49617:414-1097(+)
MSQLDLAPPACIARACARLMHEARVAHTLAVLCPPPTRVVLILARQRWWRRQIDRRRIGAIKGVDRAHLGLSERELVELQVALHADGAAGSRDDSGPVLYGPPQRHLRRALANLGADAAQHRVFEDGVERGAVLSPKSRVRLKQHPVLRAQRPQRPLLVQRVHPALHDVWLDVRKLQQLVQLRWGKVRHADGAQRAFGVQRLERAPRVAPRPLRLVLAEVAEALWIV